MMKVPAAHPQPFSKTLREIAAIEEASFQSVSESIEAGRKKFLKIFRQTP